MPPPSALGAGMLIDWNTCVARRVISWRPAAGSVAGWKRLTAVEPMSSVGGPSCASIGLLAGPLPGTPTGASSPPKLVPSSVMCQLIVNGVSMSAKRSIDVSRSAWSPKRTSRMSTLVVPCGTSCTVLGGVARVLSSGMPAYALRSRNALSVATSGVVLPSMMASARPWACAAASGSAAPFRSASAAARSSSGLAGEPRAPGSALTSNGSPRHVFAGCAWQSVPSLSAPNAGDAAPIVATTASAPTTRARYLRCAMPMPPIRRPGAQSESRGPPPREPLPARDDVATRRFAHGKKVRKLVRDRALRATPQAPPFRGRRSAPAAAGGARRHARQPHGRLVALAREPTRVGADLDAQDVRPGAQLRDRVAARLPAQDDRAALADLHAAVERHRELLPADAGQAQVDEAAVVRQEQLHPHAARRELAQRDPAADPQAARGASVADDRAGDCDGA